MAKLFLHLVVALPLACGGLSACTQMAIAPFKSFDISSPENASTTFTFSEAFASDTSPVVISIAGRKLTNDDRKQRISMQKHWISTYVPRSYRFETRFLAECGLKRDEEPSFCDVYVFTAPGSEEKHSYYIYAGNWP